MTRQHCRDADIAAAAAIDGIGALALQYVKVGGHALLMLPSLSKYHAHLTYTCVGYK